MPLRHELLDLKLVHKLIELKRVDAGAETARGRTHAERFPSGWRLLAGGKSAPQHAAVGSEKTGRRTA